VTVAVGEGTSRELTFTVHDTGIGISKEDQKRLFTSFQQVDTSTTRRHTGTGLGLAISQRLVKLMGGEITIDSTPGKGSVFRFTIPTHVAEAPVAPPAGRTTTHRSLTSSAACSGAPANAPLAILVAEDNPVNQKVLVQLLQRMGYTATVVSNGVDAVRVATQETFDLVLMDIQMPDMDGIEAMQKIKGVVPYSAHFVAVTANALVEERDRLLGTGFDEYLSKPIPAAGLREIIERQAQKVREARR